VREFTTRRIMESERAGAHWAVGGRGGARDQHPLPGIVTYSHLLLGRGSTENARGTVAGEDCVKQADRAATSFAELLISSGSEPEKRLSERERVLEECVVAVDNQGAVSQHPELGSTSARICHKVFMDPSQVPAGFHEHILTRGGDEGRRATDADDAARAGGAGG